MDNPQGRYLLLCGESYYPAIWQDFVGRFDNIEEARQRGESMIEDGIFKDWYQVIDLTSNEVVASGYYEPTG